MDGYLEYLDFGRFYIESKGKLPRYLGSVSENAIGSYRRVIRMNCIL